MLYQIKASLKGFKPLCYVRDFLLLSKGGEIYVSDLELKNVHKVANIRLGFKKSIFSKFRLSARLFRLDINYALNVNDTFALIVFRDKIWRLDYSTWTLSLEFTIPEGRTALYMTHIKGHVGNKTVIAFGEYFNNPDKVSVNIWQKDFSLVNDNWTVAHVFSSGCINHVHNIIAGSENCYILTGDFGGGAAIYESDISFSKVTVMLSGTQSCRACWAIEDQSGLIYATDTQLEKNKLCFLAEGNLSELDQIEGSSIYYGQNADGYFFSTAVEPGEPSGIFLKDILSNELGPGILSNHSYIYKLGPDGISKVFLGTKDSVPMRLGQFGSFMFPSGKRDDGNLIVYGTALKSFDGCSVLIGQ